MSTLALAHRRTGGVWMTALIAGALFLGRQIIAGGPMLRVLAAGVVISVLVVPAIDKPKTAVFALFAILPFIGMVRRLFASATGPAYLDPLLLITSAVAIAIFASLALSKKVDYSGTPLATVVFLLLVVGLIQVFNPEQGSLLIGLTGVMINLIPLTFFFIARSIADHHMTQRVVKLVMWVGAITAAYGLVQVFIGFRGFERAWLAAQGYGALTVGNTTRPFSTFTNAAEYASYVHYAFVAGFSILLFARKTRRTWMFATVALLAYSGFLIGSRGFTVKVALAIIALLAVRARHRLLAAGIIVMLLSSIVLWSATTSSDTTIQEKQVGVGQLVEQQMRALRDPLDRNKSTLPVHLAQFTEGVTFAVTERPWGIGTGATTRGAAKFGGVQAGTELDIGDSFQSLGVIGGALYVAAIVLTLRQTSRVRRALPGYVWTFVWAAALTSIGAWLNGGNYAVTPLIWFLIGAADGEFKRLRDSRLMQGLPRLQWAPA